MPFSTRLKVRFGDADPAGLVYYPVIFHYFHIALEEFFAECCGISYDRLIADERLGFPTVKSEAEFFVPLVYGDEVEITVSVSKIGTSSAVFEYRASRVSDHALCARATNIHVAMNMDTRRATPTPDKYREAFERQSGE
ncbi:MAG: acyl-CoA thioesterase [Pyrinomonadaceae bacterium]|nr:acyl-CoA thioesterase [Pyrinomonadaceae bacterium]